MKTPGAAGEPDPPDPAPNLESTIRLLAAARTGDARAHNQLVRRFLPVMLRWAHGRLPGACRPLDDTQSVVLETLQVALSHVERFEYRREGAFLAYLRTIFMNKLRDRIRGAVPPSEPLGELPGPSEGPEDAVEREEVWKLYESALTRLPSQMREAVILRLELDWDFARIADAIGCPTANAARMYVSRGICRLAKEMDGAEH